MKNIGKSLRGKNKLITVGFLFVWFLILSVISIIAPVIPFNGDEAANYLQFSRFGPIYPMFHYELPNNHVFFSSLQSLFVPRVALAFLPTFPRLLNITVAICLFLFLSIFVRRLSKNVIAWLFLTLACYFISPLVTPYFIVARGYLLGLVLLITGIYFIVRNRFFISSILFILSGWTVPTYAYALPFIYLSAIYIYSSARKKVLLSGILAIFGLFVCYLPIIGQMLIQTNVWGYKSLLIFLTQTTISVTNFSYITLGWLFNVAYILLLVFSIAIFLREERKREIKEFVTFLTISIFGYLIMICGLSIFLHVNEPFLRNGLFIPLFIVIILFSIAFRTKNNKLKMLILTMISLNILTGVYLFAANFRQSHPNYPVFAGEQYYTDDKILQQIRDRKITNVPKEFKNNEMVEYYLLIYSPSSFILLNSNQPVQVGLSSQSASISKLDIKDMPMVINNPTVYCRKEPNPIILPTSKAYLFKKIFQTATLKLIDFFDYSKRYSSQYLLSLSDSTYAESDILWKNKQYDLAIETALRAENYMTVLAGNIHVLFVRQEKDPKLYSEIQESFCLHQKILNEMANNKYKTTNDTLLDVIYFSRVNYQAMQSIKN